MIKPRAGRIKKDNRTQKRVSARSHLVGAETVTDAPEWQADPDNEPSQKR